jgi:hypothetical protein
MLTLERRALGDNNKTKNVIIINNKNKNIKYLVKIDSIADNNNKQQQ